MEGVTLIKDITHNKQLVQIEIDNLEQLEENREDILDVIIASLRKDDEKITLEQLEQELEKEGILWVMYLLQNHLRLIRMLQVSQAIALH